jgi:hypothetical protein
MQVLASVSAENVPGAARAGCDTRPAQQRRERAGAAFNAFGRPQACREPPHRATCAGAIAPGSVENVQLVQGVQTDAAAVEYVRATYA